MDTLHARTDFFSFLNNDPSLNQAGVVFKTVCFKAAVLPLDIVFFIGDIIHPVVKFTGDHPIFTFVLVGGIIYGVIVFSGAVPCLITFNAQVTSFVGMTLTKFITLAKAGGSYVLNLLPKSMVNWATVNADKIISLLRTCHTAFLNSTFGKFVASYFSIAAAKFNQLILLLGNNLPKIMLGAELVAAATLLTPAALIWRRILTRRMLNDTRGGELPTWREFIA